MKRKVLILLAVLLLLLSFSCSDDDGILYLDNIEGIVLKPISCQTDEGQVYEIELDKSITSNDGTILNRILVLNLAESFRQEGTSLKFNIRQTPVDLDTMGGYCVTLYDNSYFFTISNVKIKEP